MRKVTTSEINERDKFYNFFCGLPTEAFAKVRPAQAKRKGTGLSASIFFCPTQIHAKKRISAAIPGRGTPLLVYQILVLFSLCSTAPLHEIYSCKTFYPQVYYFCTQIIQL
jgi:hypothetical protein